MAGTVSGLFIVLDVIAKWGLWAGGRKTYLLLKKVTDAKAKSLLKSISEKEKCLRVCMA